MRFKTFHLWLAIPEIKQTEIGQLPIHPKKNKSRVFALYTRRKKKKKDTLEPRAAITSHQAEIGHLRYRKKTKEKLLPSFWSFVKCGFRDLTKTKGFVRLSFPLSSKSYFRLYIYGSNFQSEKKESGIASENSLQHQSLFFFCLVFLAYIYLSLVLSSSL